jgi:hypothetical protein
MQQIGNRCCDILNTALRNNKIKGDKNMKKFVRTLMLVFAVCMSVSMVSAYNTTDTQAKTKKAVVKLSKTKVKIKYSMTKENTKTITLENVKAKKVTYKSSDEDVAVVTNKGVITAKHPGTAIITATNTKNNKTYDCKVIVYGIKSSMTISKGHPQYVYVQNKNGDGRNEYTYKVKNKNIATVSKKGKVKAKTNGTTAITVSYKGKKAYTVNVTVEKFKISEDNGHKLYKLNNVKELYRYYHETDSSWGILYYWKKYNNKEYSNIEKKINDFFSNISGIYTMQIENKKNSEWVKYYEGDSSYNYSAYKDIVGKISVSGCDEVDFTYDSTYNYDTYGKDEHNNKYVNGWKNSSKLDSSGNILGGCSTGGHGVECDASIQKIKVGNKYYLIEIVFHREKLEISPISLRATEAICIAHDKAYGVDLSDYRKQNKAMYW